MSLDEMIFGKLDGLSIEEMAEFDWETQMNYSRRIEDIHQTTALRSMRNAFQFAYGTLLAGLVLGGYLADQTIQKQMEECKTQQVCEIDISTSYNFALTAGALGVSIGLGGAFAGIRKRRQLCNQTANEYRELLDQ